ncbi:MAG: hypothetical protein HYV15_02985 [Elusimicrobia bacterium]|nr:hypothetical protein [Elusimicrobiota bacterium]
MQPRNALSLFSAILFCPPPLPRYSHYMIQNQMTWTRIARLCGLALAAAAVGNASAQAGAGFPLNAPDAAQGALSAVRQAAADLPQRIAGQALEGARQAVTPDPVRAAIIRAAVDALRSSWSETRINGARRLVRMDPPPKEALGALVTALRDDSSYVRLYSIQTVARIVDLREQDPSLARLNRAAVDALARIMVEDGDRECVQAAEAALAQIRARSR